MIASTAPSKAEASLKEFDRPLTKEDFLNPYSLAMISQKAIKDHQARAQTEAGIIRQLLIHRHVRHRETGEIWIVAEVRLTLGWMAHLHGRKRGKTRGTRLIGLLHEVEVINPGGTDQ